MTTDDFRRSPASPLQTDEDVQPPAFIASREPVCLLSRLSKPPSHGTIRADHCGHACLPAAERQLQGAGPSGGSRRPLSGHLSQLVAPGREIQGTLRAAKWRGSKPGREPLCLTEGSHQPPFRLSPNRRSEQASERRPADPRVDMQSRSSRPHTHVESRGRPADGGRAAAGELALRSPAPRPALLMTSEAGPMTSDGESSPDRRH